MDDLDLSELTDDQIVALARMVLAEGLQRNDATARATEDEMLTAQGRLAAIRMGARMSAGARRAMEREALAHETVRQSAAELQGIVGSLDAARVEAAAARHAAHGAMIRAFADLVGAPIGHLMLRVASTGRGRRLLVNDGSIYEPPYLVDYDIDRGNIRVAAHLRHIRSVIARACGDLAPVLRGTTLPITIRGADHGP